MADSNSFTEDLSTLNHFTRQTPSKSGVLH